MVSLFGIKFGDKKKGKPERGTAAAAGDNSYAYSEKSASLKKVITNESNRSDAVSSPILPPNGHPAPYAQGIGAQNQATSSLSNLADLHSNNSFGVKQFASDVNLRAKFGAMNGSSASLAHGPGPVLSPRPQTANAKSKPWDNSDLPEIPGIRKASTAPIGPRSPLSQVATDTIPSPTQDKVEATVRLVQADENAEEGQGAISKDQQVLERSIGEEKISDEMSPTEPLARPHYLSPLDPLNGPGPVLKNIDDRPSSRGGVQDGPSPMFRGNIVERPGSRGGMHKGPGGPGPGPMFRGNIDQRPGSRGGMRDGPGGPAPTFRGNIDQKPGSRGGMHPNGPNGPPRPFPAHGHGPPRHGPPTHGLPHPPGPRNGPPGPPRQGPPFRGPIPHPGPPLPGTPNRGPARQGPPHHGIPPQGTPRQGSPHQGPPRHDSPNGTPYRGTPPPHGPPPPPHGSHQSGPHPGPHGPPHGPPGPLRPQLRGPPPQGSPRQGPPRLGPQPQGPPHSGPTPLTAPTKPFPPPDKPLPQQPRGPTPLFAPNKQLPQQPSIDARDPVPHGHATLGDLPRLQIPGSVSRPQSPAVKTPSPVKRGKEEEASPRTVSKSETVQSPQIVSEPETRSNSPSPPESIAEHLLDDDDSIFSRPIIKTLGARRDTLTIVSPRRQSLSMKIEELERSLIGAQRGRSLDDQQRSFDDKSLSSASSIYSQLHLEEDDDDDEPILSSIQPAPLRTPTKTSNTYPMIADNFSESPTADDPPTPIAKDDPETPILADHPGSFSSAGGSGYGIPTPRRGGPPSSAFRTRRPALEEYSLFNGRSTPVSRPGRSDTASTTGGNMSSPYPGTADSSTFNSPQRSNTPQLWHPPARRDIKPPTPALTPDPEPYRPAVSPLANAGFNFDFGPQLTTPSPSHNLSPSSTFGGPTGPPSVTTTGPPTPDSMIGPGPAIISPLKPAPRSSTLNRPHIPAPLNFNFNPDADSRSTTTPPSQLDGCQQSPYTPPLRRATTPAIDGSFDGLCEDGTSNGTRPSTALGAHRPPPMTPIFGQHPPRAPSRAQTPILGNGADDGGDPEEVARMLGIGVARGLSVKQPKQRAPERPPVPNPTLVDGFGTGMI